MLAFSRIQVMHLSLKSIKAHCRDFGNSQGKSVCQCETETMSQGYQKLGKHSFSVLDNFKVIHSY